MTTSFSPTSTVGEIVAAEPLLARVFEHLGIDHCCGGKRSLADACASKALDAITVAQLLSVTAAINPTRPAVDPAAMSLTALADHIEQTHHRYVRAELPDLIEKADRVAAKHAWRDERLDAVAATVRELAEEMFNHMAKEEQILFPIVRELEASGTHPHHCGSVANPIRQMEHEHDHAGSAVARLRALTDKFTPKPDDCNTHRALLAALARFEADLHEHVHKENNVLFPRAIALEAEASIA